MMPDTLNILQGAVTVLVGDKKQQNKTNINVPQSLLKTCGKQCRSPYPHLQYEHPFWTHSPCGITPQSLTKEKHTIIQKPCATTPVPCSSILTSFNYLRRSSYSQLRPVKYLGQAQKLPKMHVPPFLQQVRLCLEAEMRNSRVKMLNIKMQTQSSSPSLQNLWGVIKTAATNICFPTRHEPSRHCAGRYAWQHWNSH